MNSPNAGFLYNKISFQKLHIDNVTTKNIHVKRVNKELYSLPLNTEFAGLLDAKREINYITQFKFLTAWPGLTFGTGYGHATGMSEEEFKIGFYFDFATGLPVIPGSYVKGKLRSFFPGRYENIEKKKAVNSRLIDILKNLAIIPLGLNTDSSEVDWSKTIRNMEQYIFEGKDENGNRINMLKQDTFFEAFISKGADGEIVEGNQAVPKVNIFLGEDTITPHKHPLKDPLPLRFLKILPGVEFCFQFIFTNEGGITAVEKEKLFKHLLHEFGIGAKTSNGFGKFQKQFTTNSDPGYIKFTTSFDRLERNDVNDADDEPENDFKPVNTPPKNILIPSINEQAEWDDPANIKVGSKLKATLIKYESGAATIRLHVKQFELVKKIAIKKPNENIILVEVSNVLGNLAKEKFDVELKK